MSNSIFSAADEVLLDGLAIAAGLVCLGIFAVLLLTGMYLIIRDTVRQRGKWGLCLKLPSCQQCGAPPPLIRKPASLQQALWGGWTCKECGFELDKYGRPVDNQNTLAKWAVLPNVDNPRE